MPQATQIYRNRIALVFDFDGTLAPSTYSCLLETCGIDPEQFKQRYVEPLENDNWEHVLARGYGMIQHARLEDGSPITRQHFKEAAKHLELFPGVPEMFGRLREAAEAIVEDIELEFYLLTAGFIEIPKHVSIADEFEAIWGGDYHFDEEERPVAVKRIVTYPEKPRYLLQLAKNLTIEGPNAPEDVYRDVPPEEYHVPLDQMIYAGDGLSDMAAFGLMRKEGGIAIGVRNEENDSDWVGKEKMRDERRVENLAPADYSEGSELMESLTLAVESIAKRIALRKFSQGE